MASDRVAILVVMDCSADTCHLPASNEGYCEGHQWIPAKARREKGARQTREPEATPRTTHRGRPNAEPIHNRPYHQK